MTAIAYRDLADIAEDVRLAVEATGVFRHTSWLACDNHRQLAEYIRTVPSSPAAVVCIGSGDWSDAALKRAFTVAVVVFAPFFSSRQSKSESVWTLAEAAAAPFLPDVAPGVAPEFPAIQGVQYELRGWRPLSTDEKAASFVLEIRATEVAHYTTTAQE